MTCLRCTQIGSTIQHHATQTNHETVMWQNLPQTGTVSPMSDDAADINDPQPLRPIEPDAADCCGEGCARCVFDVYEEALERYEVALAAWRTRHPELPTF
jgi:hypothetical protein